MNKYLYIQADTNDGDYISSLSKITDEEIELIRPVIKTIKNFKSYYSEEHQWWHHHNYPNSDYCREDLGEKTPWDLYGHLEGFELFHDFVPYGENGIHSIDEILVVEIKENLL